VLYDEGNLTGAEPLFKRAIAIGEKTVGPEHPHQAKRLMHYAKSLSDQGRHEEAVMLIQRSVRVFEASLGRDHANTKKAQHWAATISSARG